MTLMAASDCFWPFSALRNRQKSARRGHSNHARSWLGPCYLVQPAPIKNKPKKLISPKNLMNQLTRNELCIKTHINFSVPVLIFL